jgi:hypothetical protein
MSKRKVKMFNHHMHHKTRHSISYSGYCNSQTCGMVLQTSHDCTDTYPVCNARYRAKI